MALVKFIAISFVSVVFFVIGILGVAWLTPFIHDQVKKDFSLATPTTRFYENFVNQSTKVRVYKIFTFFNIKNLDRVVNHSEYPIVEELGPYCYERIRIRTESDVSWQPNGTIHYRWSEYYNFVPDKSKGTESDLVTTASVGPLFAYQTASATSFSELGKLGFASNAASVRTVFTQRNVSDLVRGYKDEFLVKLWQSDPYVAVAPNEYNVSYSECYNGGDASTSQPDVPDRSFGTMTMWKGNRDLSAFWSTPQTQLLRGTDGATFPPFLSDIPEVTAFVEALRRPVVLDYAGDVEADGLPNVRRYQPRQDQFLDYAANPFNKGYHIFQHGFQPRPPVIDVADENILGAISKQHYLDCSGPYMNVKLSAPDPEVDETHLEFEPITGMLVRARKRSMLNVMLKPIIYRDIYDFPHSFADTAALNQTWLPYVSETEAMDLPSSLRDELRKEVIIPLKIAKPVGGTLLAVGLVIEALAVYFIWMRKNPEQVEAAKRAEQEARNHNDDNFASY